MSFFSFSCRVENYENGKPTEQRGELEGAKAPLEIRWAAAERLEKQGFQNQHFKWYLKCSAESAVKSPEGPF